MNNKVNNFSNPNALLEARIKAQKNMEERRAQGLPARRNPIEKALEDPASLRKAITAKCFECVGMDDDPNYRESIRKCTGHKCPLYLLRPYQKTKAKEDCPTVKDVF